MHAFDFKNQFCYEVETMLLGIFLSNIERSLHELLRYMLTAARVVMASKWKAEECPTSEDWKDKMSEYVVMAKLMNHINKIPIKEFKKKWETDYIFMDKDETTGADLSH